MVLNIDVNSSCILIIISTSSVNISRLYDLSEGNMSGRSEDRFPKTWKKVSV